jgi:hypothetical protein
VIPLILDLGTGWDNRKLISLYSVNQKRIRRVVYVIRMRRIRNVCVILVGKPEGERPRISEVSIEMRSNETGCEGVVWINLAEDRDKWAAFGDTAVKLRVR